MTATVLRYLVEARWHPGEWIADENVDVRALRNRLNRKNKASLTERIALGKLVESALIARRDITASKIVTTLAGIAERSAVTRVAGDNGIVGMALHIAPNREEEFDREIAALDIALLGHVDFQIQKVE
jgi:hypothetical protein